MARWKPPIRMRAKIEGLEEIVRKLRKRAARVKDKVAIVAVGYTATYAIYVHEDMNARHTVGQAKFLEEAFRRNARVLAHEYRDRLREGRTVSQSLVYIGLLLQKASQKLVPVDTGFLKASAFTRLERVD